MANKNSEMTGMIDRRRALGTLLATGAGLTAACVLGGCSASLPQSGATASLPGGAAAAGPAGSAPVTAALLLPLTGGAQTALVAKAMRQAAEMAIFERNVPNLQLVVKDDKGTEAGARAAAEDAIKGGAEILLGPLFSKATAAAAPLARRAGVPIISFSNDTTVAGNGVYLLSFIADQEIARTIGYALAQGRRRFAALLPSDAHGARMERLFRAEVTRAGGTIVAVERYPLEPNSMFGPARRIRDAVREAQSRGEPVDALFMPGGADTLAQIAPLVPYFEIDTRQVKLLGTGGWDAASVTREKGLDGAWFAAPDPRGWREFTERFTKNFGAMPPRVASLAYDAVGVAAALAGAPKAGRYGASSLTRTSGFNGIDGGFRFPASGLVERSLAVLEVRNQTSVVIEPATPLPLAGRPQMSALGMVAQRF